MTSEADLLWSRPGSLHQGRIFQQKDPDDASSRNILPLTLFHSFACGRSTNQAAYAGTSIDGGCRSATGWRVTSVFLQVREGRRNDFGAQVRPTWVGPRFRR